MADKEQTTQLAVIGAGPGGYPAAFFAADMGMEVTLIDPESNPGGTCLYRGCIPTKTLLHVADVIRGAEEARSWGVEFSQPHVDIDKIRAWKDRVVQKITGGTGQLTKQRKINYIQGRARLIDGQTLEIQPVSGSSIVPCLVIKMSWHEGNCSNFCLAPVSVYVSGTTTKPLSGPNTKPAFFWFSKN